MICIHPFVLTPAPDGDAVSFPGKNRETQKVSQRHAGKQAGRMQARATDPQPCPGRFRGGLHGAMMHSAVAASGTRAMEMDVPWRPHHTHRPGWRADEGRARVLPVALDRSVSPWVGLHI